MTSVRAIGILNHAPVPIWVADPDARCQFVNQAWLALSGYALADMLGDGWAQAVHPDDRARCMRRFRRAAAARQRFEVQCRLRRADGTYSWALWRAEPYSNAEHEFLGFIGCALDLSRRGEPSMLLDTLLANSPVGIAILDHDARYLYMSEAIAEMSGTVPAERIGASIPETFPDLWPQLRDPFAQALERGVPADFEIELPADDSGPGVLRRWLGTYFPVREADGTISSVGCALIEIASLPVAGHDLARSERLYQAIGEAIEYGVWVTDSQGELVYVSPSYLDMLGITMDEALQRRWSLDLDHGTEDIRREFRQCVARSSNWERELRVRGADGVVRTILSRARPVRSRAGRVVAYAGINLDITERKAIEEQLRSLNEAKDEILGLVSHELRSPLTVIVGMAHMLERLDTSMDAEARQQSISHLAQAADRLQVLIENMLTLATAEHRPRTTEPVLLQHVILQAATSSRRPVEIGVEDDLPPVEANPLWVEQVLTNLLDNADKYSPVEANVRIEAARDGRGVLVKVLDRGAGIPPEETERIFEPFYRSAREQASGAGLGLTVCKRLMELQGGAIWVAPRPGGGSEFAFTLPVAREVGLANAS